MKTPIECALMSLNGLSVGDAFGEQFFGDPWVCGQRIVERDLPPGVWNWTDDTAMGCGITRTLRKHGSIVQDTLAEYFGAEYASDPGRKYGGMAREILSRIGRGIPWQKASAEAFDGNGSYGNGAAMRAGPIGAYFSDDPALAAQQAALSACITHSHAEGIAGAVAVAVASAWAFRNRDAECDSSELLSEVIGILPQSVVRKGVEKALELGFEREPALVAAVLGSGGKVSAQDTVPFALWCAAKSLDDFGEAMWLTASGFGDVDTTCAIVGSIVSLSCTAVPESFISHREPLPMDIEEEV